MDPNRTAPGVDDHLVVPETTRDELVRGRHVIASPAPPPRADRHCNLNFVIRAHMAKGHVTSSDLLTRVGPDSDFATDTSVRRAGIDPATGERWLEELAFEVVFEQSDRDMRERAEDLTARGVRRVIAVFVEPGEVREWSREHGHWVTLPLDGVLVDPTLVRPLAIRAFLDTRVADDEVIRALEAKDNPRLARIKAQAYEQGLECGRQRGHERSRKDAVEMTCRLLDIPFGPSERAQLESLDLAALDILLVRLAAERRWPSEALE